jgi:hypothetical protein
LRRIVSVNRHVCDKQGLFYTPSHRAGVVQHLGQRNLRCVLITEHHHANRIAHENDVDTTFVEQTRRGIIVGRKRGDFLAALFHLAKILHRRCSEDQLLI